MPRKYLTAIEVPRIILDGQDLADLIANSGGAGGPLGAENDAVVTADYTITAGKNLVSGGPIEIADGVTVTVPDGSVWTVV